MKFRHKVTSALCVAVSSGLVLTGCATSKSASSTPITPTNEVVTSTMNTTTTNDTTQVGSSTNGTSQTGNQTSKTGLNSNFPAVVVQAMSSLPADVLTGAEAPSLLPKATSQTAAPTFQVSHSTHPVVGGTPYQSEYQVQVNAGATSIGSWSSLHYASGTDADKGYQDIVGTSLNTNGTPTLALEGNLTAHVTKDKSGSTSIQFEEGIWTITVTNEGTEVAPTPIADELVSYLQKHPLPTTVSKGSVTVDSKDLSGKNLNVAVLWEQDANVYQVTTGKNTANPMQSAIGMAESMKAYSKN